VRANVAIYSNSELRYCSTIQLLTCMGPASANANYSNTGYREHNHHLFGEKGFFHSDLLAELSVICTSMKPSVMPLSYILQLGCISDTEERTKGGPLRKTAG